MSIPLTAEELYASMGLSPSSTLSPSPANAEKPKFLTKQFTLFSCPALTIYLQGVHTFPSTPTSPSLIEDAFKAATARRIAKGALKGTEHLIEEAALHKNKFYADKEWHMSLVRRMLEAGMRLEVTKVAHKPTVEASIESYMDALSEFLVAGGYDSPEAYLAAKNSTADNILTLEGLQSVWDNL